MLCKKLHHNNYTYLIKMWIIHISYWDIISKKDTLSIYIYNYFSCHFNVLKPINFAWTYCFTIFTQILLKLCDIGSLWCMNNTHNDFAPFLFKRSLKQNFHQFMSIHIHNQSTQKYDLRKKGSQRIILDFYYIYYFMIIQY